MKQSELFEEHRGLSVKFRFIPKVFGSSEMWLASFEDLSTFEFGIARERIKQGGILRRDGKDYQVRLTTKQIEELS